MNARDGDPLDVTERSEYRLVHEALAAVEAHRPSAKDQPGYWVGFFDGYVARAAHRRWFALVLLALGVGAALGFVAGWVAR